MPTSAAARSAFAANRQTWWKPPDGSSSFQVRVYSSQSVPLMTGRPDVPSNTLSCEMYSEQRVLNGGVQLTFRLFRTLGWQLFQQMPSPGSETAVKFGRFAP